MKDKPQKAKRFWFVYVRETDGEIECQHLTRKEILYEQSIRHYSDFAVFDGRMLKSFDALAVHWQKEN